MLTSLWWHTFVSITDDKDRGWAAPIDDSGKIFSYTRLWACDPQDSTPTYDQANIFYSFLTSMLVVLLLVIYFCNGVNQIAQRLFWIEWLHPTLHIQFWWMKIGRCGKKSGTSRKASVMTFRGNMPHVIKTQVSWRKGKATQEIWWWMDERWTGVLPRIARYIQETQV